MAQWRGVLNEYRDRLDVTDATPIITLGEGGTPLIPAPALEARTGAKVWVKFEGMNPTGSFKDRGMTMAVSKAVEHGAKAVICASTGNTSASAAAYATHAGITAAVLVPEGKIAMGKLAQAIAHGAELLQVRGNFDDCLDIARELADNYPVHLVNSVNNDRIEGQKTAAFEVVEVLGDAPDFHFIPVGNAGNYTAYSRGYAEEAVRGVDHTAPAHVRVPGRRQRADRARRGRQGPRHDRQRHPHRQPRLAGSSRSPPATRRTATSARSPTPTSSTPTASCPARSASSSSPRRRSASRGCSSVPPPGEIPKGSTVVLTVTGHGLKDPQWALQRRRRRGRHADQRRRSTSPRSPACWG